MAWSEHTTKAFDSDLQELARTMAEMGGLAERQIAEAIEALTTRDNERAWRVINADAMIDDMQRTIEERAVETIARRQPVAVDLRQVIGILRIANELERIGDLAKNIAKRALVLNREPPIRLTQSLARMGKAAQNQLKQVLDPFTSRNAEEAESVWSRDGEIELSSVDAARWLASRIRNASLAWITRARHASVLEKPEEARGLIRDFLRA